MFRATKYRRAGGLSGEGLLCSIRREQRVAYILNHYDISPNPGGKCYSFSLNAPRYDRLMGIVRSVSREYATELSCCIVKRVVGVVAQTRPPKFTRINQVLVTHEAKRARHRQEEQDGKRHEIPRDSFTYSPGNWVQRENSENSKLFPAGTPSHYKPRFSYLCAVTNQWRRRELLTL